jgi:dTDP-4-amino-4,6-dideoxygalactose transaminase
MTDILAALGLSQMQRLDQFVTKRHIIAKRYDQMLSSLPVVAPYQHEDSYSSFHLYVIRLKTDEINKTHRQVYDALRSAGILVNLHYIPVYRHPYYEQMGYSLGYCPQAEKYYSEAISIPMYPTLTENDLTYTISTLVSILSV